MQRRTQPHLGGSDPRRRASYSDYGYDRARRAHPAPQRANPAPRRANSSASPLKLLLFGKNRAGQTPLWRVVAIDVLVFALSLLVFAFFHHAMPRSEKPLGVTSSRGAVQTQSTQSATQAPVATSTVEPSASPSSDPLSVAVAQPAATVQPTPTQAPTPTPTVPVDPIGYFGNKYADKFTSGQVVSDGTSYQSANLNVTATKLRENDADVYLVDFYVKDISCFRTEFAKGKFGRGVSEWPVSVAKRINSVVCINGDYYGGRSDGVVIRNGILYRDNETDRDVGVLYWDGTMKCFSPQEFNAEAEIENGAYQAWNFGPMLLDENGQAMTTFNSSVSPRNPRAAIGYYEPGHYCLVVVDGRTKQSRGLTLEELSAFFARMGCQAAYNLDGGATAQMVCGTERVSRPSGDGRACSDFVVVVDEIIAGF